MSSTDSKDSIFVEIKTPSMMIHFETKNERIMAEYHDMIKDMVTQYIVSEKFKEERHRKMLDVIMKSKKRPSEALTERYPGMT